MAEKVDPFDFPEEVIPEVIVTTTLEKALKQEKEALEARSKPLDSLVVSANFTVDGVVGETYGISMTPVSEMRIEGRSPRYDTGYTSRLVLKVTPRQDIPVTTLHFDGNSPVRAGDYISAKIPRYEEQETEQGPSNMFDDGRKMLYFDRAFTAEEHAIELSIRSYGKVVRTDRAVDYSRFVKENKNEA